MKKTIITALVLFMGLITYAQDGANKNDRYRIFEEENSYWTVDATFGIIASWDDANDAYHQKMGDQVNVGVTLGVARTFKSNFFTSASVSFSVAESTGLWSNPLDYLSVNLEGGYKFKTGTFFVPFVALGGNYITAPNTIANSKGSIAVNPLAGFNMWFKNSSLGFTTKFGYKIASNEFMEPHSHITVGIIKKF